VPRGDRGQLLSRPEWVSFLADHPRPRMLSDFKGGSKARCSSLLSDRSSYAALHKAVTDTLCHPCNPWVAWLPCNGCHIRAEHNDINVLQWPVGKFS
jgi:hypothetical protein